MHPCGHWLTQAQSLDGFVLRKASSMFFLPSKGQRKLEFSATVIYRGYNYKCCELKNHL
jgi:hypothetical protein